MLYIFLCTVTEEGQQAMLRDPEMFSHVADDVNVDGTQLLARYAVLGQYDYVAMVEARTHEDAARLSLELGARAHVHIETLVTIAVRQLADGPDGALETLTSVQRPVLAGDEGNDPPDYAGPISTS
ncbi:MAG: GYD domain-containing protein [Chloroflexi bacterium]|nr:GYD domain-containing protein [Chloroflexota bacterium]